MSKIEEMDCRFCQSKKVVKAGLNSSGSQRYRCKVCRRYFTPQPKPMGYSAEVRMQAVRMMTENANYRQTARYLKVNHQSVINWFRAEARAQEGELAEVDDLFTSVGGKQRNLRRTKRERSVR